MSEMYNLIDRLCKEQGGNVSRMCRELSISRSVLSELASGRTKTLSAENTALVASYLGVTSEYLISGADLPAAKTEENDELRYILESIRKSPELRAMFSLSKNSTPEQVRQYINVIKAIRGEED